MSIVTNVDLVNTYDDNNVVHSTRVLSPGDDAKEHAAQCEAIEMLRSLLALGLSIEDYNNMSNETWESLCAEARVRAALNVNAPVASLSAADHDAACNIGGNYFEHGYQTIMDGVAPQDKITFTKIGGL